MSLFDRRRQFLMEAYPPALVAFQTIMALIEAIRAFPQHVTFASSLDRSFRGAFVTFLDAPTPEHLANIKAVWDAFQPALLDTLVKIEAVRLDDDGQAICE